MSPEDLLTRELDSRSRSAPAGTQDLASIRSKARGIRRRRAAATGVGVLAVVAAIGVPIALSLPGNETTGIGPANPPTTSDGAVEPAQPGGTCTSANGLHLESGQAEGAAGSVHQPFFLTADVGCTITGYPVLNLLDGGGDPMGFDLSTEVTPNTPGLDTKDLVVGPSALSTGFVVVYPTGCQTTPDAASSTSAEVALPGLDTLITVPLTVPQCVDDPEQGVRVGELLNLPQAYQVTPTDSSATTTGGCSSTAEAGSGSSPDVSGLPDPVWQTLLAITDAASSCDFTTLRALAGDAVDVDQLERDVAAGRGRLGQLLVMLDGNWGTVTEGDLTYYTWPAITATALDGEPFSKADWAGAKAVYDADPAPTMSWPEFKRSTERFGYYGWRTAISADGQWLWFTQGD